MAAKARRDTGADRLWRPLGWLIYPITDSKYLNCTLSEVLDEWTFGDISDAWARMRYYSELEKRREARQRRRNYFSNF